MTVVEGSVESIGMSPLSGLLTARVARFRPSGGVLFAPESVPYPIVAGQVSADLAPGPAQLTVQVGSHARERFDVVIPDEGPVSLASLVEEAFPWEPEQVREFVRLRDEAVAAAEDAAGHAEDAAGSAAAAAGSASAAASSASDAAGSAASASSSAGAAASDASAAAGSASAAASSASAAQGSAGDAASSAASAADSASDAAGSATGADTARAGAEAARDAADGHADRAEQAVNSFDLTATATTGAEGSNATVTVTGDGPAYGLSFTVPRGAKGDKGDKGDRGDDGEVSQAALDAAVASLVDNAPEALDTLSELADALGNDPNFATTVSTQIGERAKTSDVNAALAGKADAGAENTATWSGVSGKPSTFPPTTGDSASTAKPGDWLPAWSDVAGKPSTFPPAAHTHTPAEVGLGNVDNTSDADKPVSTATQAALDGKEPASWTGTQAQYDALGSYDPNVTYYVIEE